MERLSAIVSNQSYGSRRLWGLALLLLIAVAMLSSIGCGYALVGRGTNIPDDVAKVFVSPFENQTTRSEIEQFITSAVSNELVTRQRFTIVNTVDSADAIIDGKITTFRATPITFDADGRALEYETTIIASVTFKRAPPSEGEDGEVLWSNSRYLFKETYDLDASDEFFDQENIALDDTAELFAKTMVSDLLEGF